MFQLNTGKQILFIKTTGIRVCLPNNKGVIMASWKQNTFESRINLLVSRSSCSTSLSSQPDFLQNIPSNIKNNRKSIADNITIHTLRWKHGRTKVTFQVINHKYLTVSSHAYASREELTQRTLSQSAQEPRNAPLWKKLLIKNYLPVYNLKINRNSNDETISEQWWVNLNSQIVVVVSKH